MKTSPPAPLQHGVELGTDLMLYRRTNIQMKRINHPDNSQAWYKAMQQNV